MKTTFRRAALFGVLGALLVLAQDASAYYDPSVQRWINRDPIGENGGLNAYTFVSNDPVRRIDSFGLRCCITYTTPCTLAAIIPPTSVWQGASTVFGGNIYYCGRWRFTCTYLCTIASTTGTCPTWAVAGTPLAERRSFSVWVAGSVAIPGPIPTPAFACPATATFNTYCF